LLERGGSKGYAHDVGAKFISPESSSNSLYTGDCAACAAAGEMNFAPTNMMHTTVDGPMMAAGDYAIDCICRLTNGQRCLICNRQWD
jgi:hypothetical protein